MEGTFTFTTSGRVTSDGGRTYTKTYTQNFTGEWVSFEDEDLDVDSREIAVRRIRPEAYFLYSPDETAGMTNGTVDVTVSFSRPNITILNNGGSPTYTFATNGEFTFVYVDEYGFTGEAKAKVTWATDVSSFVMTWDIPYGGYTVTVPSNGVLGYNYEIDWGDGSAVEHKVVGNPQHTYADAGNYQIKIRGKF